MEQDRVHFFSDKSRNSTCFTNDPEHSARFGIFDIIVLLCKEKSRTLALTKFITTLSVLSSSISFDPSTP
ncbi:unnamed protein product [Rhizophagus irregularis]|nr:unnamed protein product [Rhizophagus irregularis]